MFLLLFSASLQQRRGWRDLEKVEEKNKHLTLLLATTTTTQQRERERERESQKKTEKRDLYVIALVLEWNLFLKQKKK